jgi:hypothetical protein
MQIKSLVRMLDDPDADELPKEIFASLKAKEIERRGLEARAENLGVQTNVSAHPAIAKVFAESIDKLHKMLKRNPDDPGCRMAFANLIDGVLVHPTGYDEKYEISMIARLAAIRGDINLFPKPRSNEEIVAAEGVPRVLTQSGTIHHRHHPDRPPPLLLCNIEAKTGPNSLTNWHVACCWNR